MHDEFPNESLLNEELALALEEEAEEEAAGFYPQTHWLHDLMASLSGAANDNREPPPPPGDWPANVVASYSSNPRATGAFDVDDLTGLTRFPYQP